MDNNHLRPFYIAWKSQTKNYGYTVRDMNGSTTWFTGPKCTGGWYKRKKDAQERADILNAAVKG